MITQRRFMLDGPPRGQGRPRWGNGRMYKAGIDVVWEDAISMAYKAAYPGAQMYEGAVAVHVECYVPIPKSDKAAKTASISTRPSPVPRAIRLISFLDAS